MDYDFKKNTLDGSYHVRFSMGHEVLGRWFIEELGKDKSKMELILAKLVSHKDNAQEWRLVGEELTLVLQENEALVQANFLFATDDSELEDAMSFYDEESISVCGFEDLIQAITAWRTFIERY
ncbi:YacL family protein [Vibrio tapetis subsp. quintayensis]|uniref:YacL family protein n=1 Tax=Vibrio tapetis TaxID=52443 RepID=UPI0025B4AADC|nr:YacL family protein [Vibrio tapetis]MDN3681508.1 YacL family protein [Vibrio tapetis subsp. quintayensis]